MVSSLVLNNEAFVAFHALQNHRLLDRPGADILPLLLGRLVRLLFGVRCLPPRVPIICELLEKRSFEIGRLDEKSILADGTNRCCERCKRTVKVGLAMLVDEVADSPAEETEADASEVALLTSSTASAREAATAIRIAEVILWKRIANGDSLSNSGNCCQVVEKKTRQVEIG